MSWRAHARPWITMDSLARLAHRIDVAAIQGRLSLPWKIRARLRDVTKGLREQATSNPGLRRTLLFDGPDGSTALHAAAEVAGSLSADLYRVDLSTIVSKYIGETEKNLRRLFDAAEESGAVLFFDEADALFGKRSEVRDSHDRYANIEIDYLLQRIEAFPGVVVLATNATDELPPKLLRLGWPIVRFRPDPPP